MSGLTEPDPAGRVHDPTGAPEGCGLAELWVLEEVTGLALKDTAGFALVEPLAFADAD